MGSDPPASGPASVRAGPERFDADLVLSADRGRLIARWRALEAARTPPDDPRRLAFDAEVAASRAAREARAGSIPPITLDESLPIAREADRIVEAIRRDPVVVVAGETGSGKTTQLPKLCLAAGRGTAGWIGCTQPRRIAARSVARRVAQELATPIGGLVGWQVRFTEEVGPNALVKFMTDGILLAETQTDRWLSRYDTLIIDEAHERSLNIDLLLGYLKQLLERRRDLRLVVTSATIDTARFARFFGDAPVIEVEGRSYPVEVRWRPPAPERGAAPDLASQIVATVDEIGAIDPLGDVLVFLPGEREIRDVHLALERRRLRATEVLPLYARLSARDQDRVFNPGPGRRIVLATNVAETSLTVPRIRHVIDPGLARVNRWSHRHKVQRLHVEPISQASADQRKGRCGRIASGTCWRLYDEADYAARPRYTDPELKRSSLAGVILRLLSLGMGPVEAFPFLDPPDERAIRDGYQQLLDLAAIEVEAPREASASRTDEAAEAAPRSRGRDRGGRDRKAGQLRLTGIGRRMARLPIDVKLARVLVEAERLGCLREACVIAAFLSIQDPRERPAEARALADSAHAHYHDPASDFVGVLRLWDDYRAAHEELTQSKLRDWCQQRFLSFMRMREWRELHRQLLVLFDELGWALGAEDRIEPAEADSRGPRRGEAAAGIPPRLSRRRYEALHRALISGFPDQVARRDEKGQYVGTRGRRYLVFPGSGLAKKPPAWLLSATLLDTQRLYGLTNAAVEPEWIEQQCAHLVRHAHFDPHWSRAQGRVLGHERVTLLGLTLVERRRVAYERIDPVAARAVFLREALVPGEIDCRAAFVHRNRETLERARAEEDKRRRKGLLRDDEELAAWIDARIPPGIANAVALDAWYKTLDAERRRDLEWTLDDLLRVEAVPERAFPTALRVGRHRLALEYRFDPTDPDDGVTVIVPLELLNALPVHRLGWLVPGLLVEKVTELIRALPKPLRRHLVPAPDFARAFVDASRAFEASDEDLARQPLADSLAAHFERMTGVAYPPEDFDERELPKHLRFNVRLLDERGQPLASSRDLAALKAEYGARARAEFARATASDLAREDVARWDFGDLPETIATDTGLAAYPALVDTGERAAIRVFEDAGEARAAHGGGVLRLVRLALADKARQAARQLPLSPKAAIAWTAIGSPEALRADLVEAALDELARDRVGAVRSAAAFEALVADLGRSLFAAAVERLAPVEATLVAYATLAPKLTPELMGFARANYDDLKAQLGGLVHPGFARAPRDRLADLPRYLKAMEVRLVRLRLDPRRDQARMLEVREFEDWLARLEPRLASDADRAEWTRIRWLIEEFRVQTFAQELKTREPVSEKRLRRMLSDLEAGLHPIETAHSVRN
jgi:ATP-dependent helicase HrpA